MTRGRDESVGPRMSAGYSMRFTNKEKQHGKEQKGEEEEEEEGGRECRLPLQGYESGEGR